MYTSSKTKQLYFVCSNKSRMANNVVEEGKLLHLFDEIWAMHKKLENSSEPSNSDAFQVTVPSKFIIPVRSIT